MGVCVQLFCLLLEPLSSYWAQPQCEGVCLVLLHFVMPRVGLTTLEGLFFSEEKWRSTAGDLGEKGGERRNLEKWREVRLWLGYTVWLKNYNKELFNHTLKLTVRLAPLIIAFVRTFTPVMLIILIFFFCPFKWLLKFLHKLEVHQWSKIFAF